MNRFRAPSVLTYATENGIKQRAQGGKPDKKLLPSSYSFPFSLIASFILSFLLFIIIGFFFFFSIEWCQYFTGFLLNPSAS